MKRLLFLVLTGVCWGQALTPKAMIERERPLECQMSPDGRWLAVQVGKVSWKANRVESELQVYQVGNSQPMLRLPHASSPRWSADSSQLLCHRYGGLWRANAGISPGSWRWRQVVKQEVDSAIWSPDGEQVAYVAAVGPAPSGDSGRIYDDLFLRRWNHYWDGRRRHIYVVDLATGKSRDVTPGDRDAGPTSGTFSSGDNLSFSPDGLALFYSAPPARGQAWSTNYDVYRVELASLQTDNLTAANPAADFGPRVAAGRLYVISHARPGYESDFPVVKSCAVGASGQLLGEWTDEKLGDELGELAWPLYTKDGRGYWKERALPHAGTLHSLTGGSGRWAGIEAGLSLPSQVVVGDLAGSRVQRLGERPDWKLGAVESLQVPVEGASMQMWLVKPPDYTQGRRYPLVVLVHGGPQGRWGDDWSLRWNAQCWAAQGWMVALPNPRGSSGQGRAFQEQVSRDWGGLAYRDLMAGVDALVARPDVDSSRVAACGASYGGYMVNWLAVNTKRFKAFVTHCGIFNLESMYGVTDELWFADWELGGPPWGPGRPVDYDRFSPHRYAERLKTPHLVIHNDLDYRCPIDQGLQLFTALQRQGVESRFLNFPDEGHWVVKPANSLRWYLEVFHFVGHHLRAGQ